MNSVFAFDADATIGAYQIGVLVSYVLFGVTTTQAYIYFGRFPDDNPKFKVLVAFVWICEVGHAVCLGHTLYTFTIKDFADPLLLFGPVPKSFETSVLLSGVVGTCAQGFFGFRIYALSKKLCIPILIWIMGFLCLLGCFVIFVGGLKTTSLVEYIAQWGWLATSVWSISTANDVTITAMVVFLLYRQRNKVQKRTAALVDKIILWTLETGFLTSVTGLIALVFFVTMKKNLIWTAFYALTARLFSNSLLASLNSRTTLRSLHEVSMQPSVTPLIGSRYNSSNKPMLKVTPISSNAGELFRGDKLENV
ncbi:hypothetical protein MSAN_02203600 [Mycena sanguinolenta]|uniref:DUF6534 domain-containing protein n=1 Tax=Mycena sanguinolenta TaxID=230812 RepID=A0A8H6XE51_9AGAR|nr:hypothetical protein MSAN_02203600 [Mycena sanguinolenta]